MTNWDLSKFKPNLAASPPDEVPYDWRTFPFNNDGLWLASPKIDGIRIVCHPTLGPVSRSLKPIPNAFIWQILQHSALKNLDGEVVLDWNDPRTFNRTQSAVMSRDGCPSFEYRVFDNIEAATTCGFGVRLNDAQHVVDGLLDIEGLSAYVKMVPHVEIRSYEQFEAYEAEQLALGFEGVMLRHKAARYKFGRSTWREGGLIKVKRFEDAEGVIVDWEPLERNENEATLDNLGLQKRSSHKAGKVADDTRVGNFILRVLNGNFAGVLVSCGSGLTNGERLEYRTQVESWIKRGQLVTFKYQAHGSKDAPRLPIFKGLRANE